MHQNYILTSTNGALTVTNLQGVFPTTTLSGLPLGTVDGTATGELVLKVMNVGGGGGGGSQVEGKDAVGGSFTHNPFIIGNINGDGGIDSPGTSGVNVNVTNNPLNVNATINSCVISATDYDTTLPVLLNSEFTSEGNALTIRQVGLNIPNIYKSVSASSSGNTAVWTPTTGKTFRLLKFIILATSNISVTGAATITVSFQDGTNPMGISFPVFVPTAAGTILSNIEITGWIDLGGTGFKSQATNRILNVNLSGALTTGSFVIFCCGIEE